jgi:ribosomal protein S27E
MTDEEQNPNLDICITASMDDWRTCTIKGEHRIICDGWQMNARAGGWVACTGCLPKEATVGRLCAACHRRVELALVQWTVEKAEVLRGLERAVAQDNGGIRSASSGHVNLPAPFLAYEEVESHLRGYPGRLDYWAATPKGAEAAVRFARAATSALNAHELEERTHIVQHVRCPDCEHLNLVWTPPTGVHSRVTVTCQNSECGTVLTQDDVEHAVLLQQGVTEPVVEPAGPVTLDPNDAEPFNPEYVEHSRFDILSTRPLAELQAIGDDLEVPRVRQLRKTELITAIREAQRDDTAA